MALSRRTALPTLTTADTLMVLNEVMAPNIAKGVLIRRPGAVGMAERLGLDARAVERMQRLRARYGHGPVLLRLPLRSQALILAHEHVHHVLENSPEPFATAESAKRAALSHFEPKVALISHGSKRAQRRAVNDRVLESHQRIHDLADQFLPIVEQEADALLDRVTARGELDWDAFIEAWYRVVRRVVLGDSAREDHMLTDMLSDLRARGNWAFMLPRQKDLSRRFLRLLHERLARAEPGSLASIMARIPKREHSAAEQQVPQWLFAFDPAGMATFRALALLSSHPHQALEAEQEIRRGDRELPFLRSCVLESLRLWPTTPAILRQTTTDTVWENGMMPRGTSILIFAPYFHRDSERFPSADRFTPELWLDGQPPRDWALVPFSEGPAFCPGRNLVLLLTSHMMARLLEGREIRQLPPTRLLKSRPLPGTLDNYSLRFTLHPRPAAPVRLQPAVDAGRAAREHR